VRLYKTVFTVVFVSVFAVSIRAQEAGPDDLSAYYGFQEIEIIKLDWGIQDLRVADFDGDGRNDIAIANNRKARIELLLQKEAIGPDPFCPRKHRRLTKAVQSGLWGLQRRRSGGSRFLW